MGLHSSPQVFINLMRKVLAGLTPFEVLVYIDDICIKSSSWSDHMASLRRVLTRIKEANMTIELQKCHFAKEEVRFLGHIVSAEGITADPAKIEAVTAWPTPQSAADVRSFLGLAGYYRNLVQGFSAIAEPLRKLQRKGAKFVWSEECQVAFATLKSRLSDAPVVMHFDPALEIRISTDACIHGLGAVVEQKDLEGTWRVLAYASKSVNNQQYNYTVTELECLAMTWGISLHRPYLHGRSFRAVTDHMALQWLAQMKNPSGRNARWLMMLSEYDFTPVHRPGSEMGHADSLSRTPVNPLVESSSAVEHPSACIHCNRLQEIQTVSMAIHQVLTWESGLVEDKPSSASASGGDIWASETWDSPDLPEKSQEKIKLEEIEELVSPPEPRVKRLPAPRDHLQIQRVPHLRPVRQPNRR